MDLKGAVALVTGGNGGLGQRICHALSSFHTVTSSHATLAFLRVF